MTKEHRAGQDVVSYCGRCKMDLAHVVHAVVNGVAAKVGCNTCGAIHKYRRPKSEKAPRKSSTSTRTSASKGKGKARATGRRTSGPEPHEIYAKAIEGVDLSEPKAYNVKTAFVENDVVQHKLFGIGLVTSVKGDRKVEVLFEVGTKLLVHAR